MSEQTEMEIAGVKFKGGKIFLVLTALSTLIGGAYGAFEVYKDYMDMKEQIQNYVAPDLSGIEKQIATVNERVIGMDTNMTETADRVSDIKNDLRDDLVRMEKIIDQLEDKLQEQETDVRQMIQNAEERFENKRDALQNDYDQAKDRLQTQTAQELKDLEDRLNKRLQRALDNPLAN